MMTPMQPTECYRIGYKEDTLKAFELRNAITLDLARRFPQAKIIGVDIGADAISRAQAMVPACAPNTRVEFRVGDILEPSSFLTPEELAAGFDVVHEHTTLVCIPNNIEVLRRMKQRARRDGGIAGRKLLSKALEVGLKRDQITAAASVLSNITRAERLRYAGSMLFMLGYETSQYRRAAAKFGYSDKPRLLWIRTELICRRDEDNDDEEEHEDEKKP
ncbi:hypothetical protein VTJ83DRAFT_3264 [Remersonia thermophila]|uniref:Methyltransferase domain-containing protein n=1 Tax=Remersonia thermophila TaxID=72144 RepID=A0ABR4DDI9_9PEZI